MRHVVTNQEVAHLFAARRKEGDWGRNSSDSVSFQGDSYYSYSTRIAERYVDKDIVLVSSGTYSNTTARHLSDLRSAFRGHSTRLVTVPYVSPGSDDQHWSNMSFLMRECREAFQRGRGNRNYVDRRDESIDDWLAYCTAFKLSKFYSRAEREIVRAWKTDSRQRDELYADLRASLDNEREILQRLMAEESRDALNRVKVLLGFGTDDDFSDQTFGERVATKFLEEVAKDHDPACMGRWQEKTQRDASYEAACRHSVQSHRALQGKTPEEIYHGWRTHDPEICQALQSGRRRVYVPRNPGRYSQGLRVLNGRVQTTSDVRLSMKDAKRVWTLLLSVWRVRHDPVQFYARCERVKAITRDIRIDRAYSIDWINSEGTVKSGCHTIAWDDIAWCAKEAGFSESILRWHQPRLTSV